MEGLKWTNSKIKMFNFDDNQKLKIPHMGWNHIRANHKSPIFSGFEKDARFYFVHSYYMVCKNAEEIKGTTTYGFDFPSVIQKDNIVGVQFHPEKSHKFGMKLLQNFVEFF